jgi:hypothetical protein
VKAPRLRWLLPLAVAFSLTFPASVLADAPTADAKTPTTLEDHFVDITLSGGDADGDALTFAIATSPTAGSLGAIGTPSCDGLTPSSCTAVVRYTPDADANGADSFSYTVNDGAVDSAAATVSITITAVNDAPSFTKGSNQTILKDSGAQTVTGWASAISAGPPDEAGQTLTFNVTNDTNTSLFSVLPAISESGTLTYTPTGTTTGMTTVTIDLSDDGGTGDGGVDTSATQTFTITVNPLVAHNDAATIPEDAPATTINVLANDNPPPNPQVPLTITQVGSASHGTVAIATGGAAVTYKPNTGYVGSDLFSYTMTDGTLTATASVVVSVTKDTIAPVANPPVQTIRTGVTMNTTIGVRIAWSATDAGVGVAKYQVQVSVDGGAYSTITLPTALTTSSNRLLTVNHTYRFRMRATDKNGNVSGYKYGPTFKVLRIQDGSGSIVYGGTWAVSSNSNESGGTSHYAGTAGKTATITTTGRDFAFVGPRSSTRGSLQIYVDGVLSKTISETSSTTSYRRVLWAVHFSTLTTHTIRVVVVGPSRIDLDCFLILR